MATCFCTLAIDAPYRRRARALCADPSPVPWVVVTDEPSDFAELPVRTVRHSPTGPMAIDYLQRVGATGNGRGAAAYHDKRFAVRAALEQFDTAIFLDADSRLTGLHTIQSFPPGLALTRFVRRSVAQHLAACGGWRLDAFQELALTLMGTVDALDSAPWCHETLYAVTKDGREDRFFHAWTVGADLLQRRGVYSGEGGVMGLAAVFAGWTTDYDALAAIEPFVHHEGGGPKNA